MRPGDVQAQVDTGDHVAVIQGRTQAVAPGEVGEEAVVFTPGAAVWVSCRIGRADTVGIRALTEQGVTTVLGAAITRTDTTDIVGTHFTYQGQPAGTHHAVDEMHG